MHNESIYHLQATVIYEHVPGECRPWKKARKTLQLFPSRFFFLDFVNRQFIGMTVPQGDQTAAEENWSVIGVLWQFSIHSGIGHDCWEMNSSPHCKFDFLLSS